MGMSIDNSCEPKPMSKEEIVDTLKTMVFGVRAFERFNAKERETLDKVWNLIDQYEARLRADKMATFKEFRDKLSKWMFRNSESVCGNSMIDIDYLEGYMDELLYELGIYEVDEGDD